MDNNLSSYVVFFDIGDTLGSAIISPPPDYLLEGLDVYSYIPGVIKQLKDHDIRLGIISNTGNNTAKTVDKVLEEAGILKFFENDLRIYSAEVALTKDSPEIFQLAAEQAGKSDHPEQCLYVGEDSTERSFAVEAGWQVVPHPILAWDILQGDSIRFVRLSVPANQSQQKWRSQIGKLSVATLHITGQAGTKVYAIASNNSIMRLDDLGFEVDRLGSINQPLTTEVYLLRDDRQVRTGFLNPEGQSSSFLSSQEEAQWILASTAEGLYLALPGGRSIEEYHFEEAYHGHTLKLLPDLTLLEPFGEDNNARTATFLRVPPVEPSLSNDQLAKLREITPESIQEYLARYTGVEPLNGDSEYKIKSRHIQHSDMALVTEALAKDLQKIGGESFAVRVHRFVHEGKILDNVEAELKGSDSEDIVLVTAHLDSTAAFSDHPFDPETDSSPGADDDASGIAGVLAIANIIKQIAEVAPLKRTIRFVLFNAEEHGLIGSRAYARNQAALDVPIVAVYQMDMIGYNVKPPRSFEVHVGYSPAPEVEARSLVLAERINRLAPELSPELELPQIYTQPDPAEGRSDHASFHEHGYAACITSEDFFAGPHPGSPTEEPNPNYHKDQDTFVDLEYAADIARVIAGAALVTANLTNNNQGVQIMTNQWQQSSEKIGRVAALAAKISDIPVGVDPPLLGSRMRIWKQDPSVQGLQVPRTVYLHDQVNSGPSDSQMAIKGLPPVGPDFKQDFLFDPVTDEEAFDAVHTYTIVRQTVTMYQRVLGRKLQWAWNNAANQEGIEVHPHAGVDANAYYSRFEKALKFFYFTPITSPGSSDRVFTCRSLDIVAHEAGHAILDGLKPGWLSSFPPQTGGLHEAFGDLTSIFLILSQLDLVEYIIAETKSDLHQKTILSGLAEQFGIGLGRPPALRNADNNLKLSEVSSQVHDISQVFTGGVYDILADVFASNRDPRKRSDAEVLYESGQYMASLTIRAIINAPDSNATYANVVNNMISLATSDGHTDYVDFIRKHFEFREVIGASAFTNVVDLSQLGLFSNRCGCCGTLQSPEYL